jgi:hypothetical protein
LHELSTHNQVHDEELSGTRNVCEETKTLVPRNHSGLQLSIINNIPYYTGIPVPSDKESTDSVMQEILNNFALGCSVEESFSCIDLPRFDCDYDTRIATQKMHNDFLLEIEKSEGFSEYIKNLLECKYLIVCIELFLYIYIFSHYFLFSSCNIPCLRKLDK